MTKAGKMVHVIKVQRFTDTVNAYGTPTKAWIDHVTLRAQIVEQSTTEYIRNQGASDEKTIIFRTRFVEGLTNADRISFRADFHNIREIKPMGRRKGLEIRCGTIEGAS